MKSTCKLIVTCCILLQILVTAIKIANFLLIIIFRFFTMSKICSCFFCNLQNKTAEEGQSELSLELKKAREEMSK